MATLLQLYNLRFGGTQLKARVTAAIARAAHDVVHEDPATPAHAARVQWARTALGDAHQMAERMFWGVLGNPTIQDLGDASSDGDIQFVVNSLIETYSVGA